MGLFFAETLFMTLNPLFIAVLAEGFCCAVYSIPIDQGSLIFMY